MVAGFDAAAMVDGDLLHDGQSQATTAAIRAGAGGIPPIKALEHASEIGLTQARAMVTNTEQPPAAALSDGHVNAAPMRGVAKCIVEKVEHRTVQPALITTQGAGFAAVQLQSPAVPPRSGRWIPRRCPPDPPG